MFPSLKLCHSSKPWADPVEPRNLPKQSSKTVAPNENTSAFVKSNACPSLLISSLAQYLFSPVNIQKVKNI